MYPKKPPDLSGGVVTFHELSHFVNLENPDEIFYERADEKSIQLWNLLKENKKLNCIVEGKGK